MLEGVHFLSFGKLVEAVLVAPDLGAESAGKPITVPIMVTVGQITILGRLPSLEPLQPLGWHPRVDQDGWLGGSHIVRMNILLDPLVKGAPVKETGQALLHG